MVSLLASIGFVLAITSFIAGFKMVKRTGQRAERSMHRLNGYATVALYVAVAAAAVSGGTAPMYVFLWALGFALHMLKLLLVRKRLAARYGGYIGAMLVLTWVVIIFTHLPA